MFKKKKDLVIVFINGNKYEVEKELYKDITHLIEKFSRLEIKASDLECELKHIKPILENPDLKPALSEKCMDCKFVIISPFNRSILRCRKGVVCDDFVQKED